MMVESPVASFFGAPVKRRHSSYGGLGSVNRLKAESKGKNRRFMYSYVGSVSASSSILFWEAESYFRHGEVV